MKKYYKIIIPTVFIFIFIIIIFWLTKPKDSKNFFINSVPFLNNNNSLPSTAPTETFKGVGIPAQTNYKKVVDQITNEVSSIEKEKIIDILPIRINDFNSETQINTTINVFTLASDPPQSARIEIYGPNFNNSSLTGQDAIAFKNSFNEIKQIFTKNNVNLNNLQIIYGNRQYIQDTATFWVKEFKLLD
jgi:energy-coupling factor transporter transmembrane protein EcfT